MKLLAVVFVVLFVGSFAQDPFELDSSDDTSASPSTELSDVSTTLGGGDVTSGGSGSPDVSTTPSGDTPGSPEPTESTTAGSPGPTVSTTVGPTVITTTGPTLPSDATESSDSTNPSSGTTVVPVTTVVTEAPTTTVPLNREVTFNVDCTGGKSCSFKFTIDERLVRSINNTALEAVLSQLSTSINNASSYLGGLKDDEESYSAEINGLISNATAETETISLDYNVTSTQVDDLVDQTAEALTVAQNYLKSALCFQNDADSSIGCGDLAGLSY